LFTIYQDTMLSYQDYILIKLIKRQTAILNRDNVSRTKAYLSFFRKHPSIKWSFLASMVSRNAGYSMCDLEGEMLKNTLNPTYRTTLFLTYEKANYLIFQDAFPQLLLYHYSTKLSSNKFHLLKYFSVSQFMETEWRKFWIEQNQQRLIISLIINEQNIIQKPVIEEPFYKKKVFHSGLFILQDLLHFSTVLFPMKNGELYGATVHHFTNLDARIDLGKKLAAILFDNDLFPAFFDFAVSTEHTGSRRDYERYTPGNQPYTPFLRMVYPIVSHEEKKIISWDQHQKIKRKWRGSVRFPKNSNITSWYRKKQNQLRISCTLSAFFRPYDKARR